MAAQNVIIAFILSLTLAFFIGRISVFLFVNKPQLPFYRQFNLNLHHFHLGLILTTIASFWIIFYRTDLASAILLGSGLGFMLDELVPSLLLKTQRKHELEVYHQGLAATIVIFIVLIIAMLLLLYL